MIAALCLLLTLQKPSIIPTKPIAVRNLKPVQGGTLSIPSANAKFTVAVFLGLECPIANRMAPELQRIRSDYAPKGVTTVLIYADLYSDKPGILKHDREFGLSGPSVADPDHKLVKLFNASVTPQAFIVDSKGKVLYMGRVNDLFEEHGRSKEKPEVNDLRDALDEALAGKPVSHPVTQAVGCFLGD